MNKFYIALFFLWTFTSIFIFGMGYHNVDLSYNFKGSTDCNDFNCVDMNVRYSSGLTAMTMSFFMLSSEMFFLVYKSMKGEKIIIEW